MVNETQHFQSLIDDCAANGGGRVTVPAGEHLIGTLFLKSQVELHLEKDAVLLGSDQIEDYSEKVDLFTDAVGQPRGRALIYAEEQQGVSLTGEGTVDGRGMRFKDSPHYRKRPFLVRFVHCEDVRLEEVHLTGSAAWCLHISRCRGVTLNRVDIQNRGVMNNDGVDIDSTQDVVMDHCRIDSGDDGICLKSTFSEPCRNIRVSNCYVSSNWAAFKIGTESVGDYENIVIDQCTFENVQGCGIKIVPVDGASVENVTVSNCTMTNVVGPIFLRLGERLRTYHEGHAKTEAGSFRNVTLKNIEATVVSHPKALSNPEKGWHAMGLAAVGIPGHEIENIHFENVRLKFGEPADENVSEFEEKIDAYPEFFMFGQFPGWMTFRHCRDITFNNMQIEMPCTTIRPGLSAEHCTNVNPKGESGEHSPDRH